MSQQTREVLQMPQLPNPADLDETPGAVLNNGRWHYLETSMNRIMRDPDAGVDTGSFVGLYTAVTNYTTSGKGAHFPKRDESGSGPPPGAHNLGGYLYARLLGWLSDYLGDLKELIKPYSGEDLLCRYFEEWHRYITSAKRIRRFFQYFDRHWIRREQDEGNKKVFDVYTSFVIKWRQEIYSGVCGDLVDVVRELGEKHFHGEALEHPQTKTVMDRAKSLELEDPFDPYAIGSAQLALWETLHPGLEPDYEGFKQLLIRIDPSYKGTDEGSAEDVDMHTNAPAT
ncbi:hypothetical protein JX265_005890 [Neoarthrinium moseri]|uniref:Cullin N-terminal domain-containing protein n=1 Tax=Neoarthrinium moseri TaxID=1658444 RepID=A0A9Q0ARM7_9PEZI|nr:hypothetical protein JX265_005890 [Neoarthrinium moseri]